MVECLKNGFAHSMISASHFECHLEPTKFLVYFYYKKN